MRTETKKKSLLLPFHLYSYIYKMHSHPCEIAAKSKHVNEMLLSVSLAINYWNLRLHFYTIFHNKMKRFTNDSSLINFN